VRLIGRRQLIAGVLATVAVSTACSVGASGHSSSSPAAAPVSAGTTAVSPTPTPSASSTSRLHSVTASRTAPPSTRPHTAVAPKTSSKAVASPARLPLHFSTGAAQQVITVTASSTSSTEGTLQAWRKSGSGWRRVDGPVRAHLGSDGLSVHPSESRSATPIGSFTLTQAFGHDADPGTALPYTQTTPDDWWISQSGSLYNTRQRCASSCGFTRGDPNEHLYYETPYYNYAVVIDYNTRNAPGGVHAGAGSAFFLHVTVGAPTAGCVSIDQSRLVRLLRWLTPSEHPRIRIGVS
jgi:L,D-peptidoglycan transpeptidase YkuD (ErfK/YbiS/YcfS/YnhG family)